MNTSFHYAIYAIVSSFLYFFTPVQAEETKHEGTKHKDNRNKVDDWIQYVVDGDDPDDETYLKQLDKLLHAARKRPNSTIPKICPDTVEIIRSFLPGKKREAYDYDLTSSVYWMNRLVIQNGPALAIYPMKENQRQYDQKNNNSSPIVFWIHGPFPSPTKFVISPKGDLLAVKGMEGKVYFYNLLWNPDKNLFPGQERGWIKATNHARGVEHISFSHDGKLLVTSSHVNSHRDPSVKLWPVQGSIWQEKLQPAREFKFPPADKLAVSPTEIEQSFFSLDDSLVVTVCNEHGWGGIVLWDPLTGEIKNFLKRENDINKITTNSPIIRVQLSNDNKTLMAMNSQGTIYLYNRESNNLYSLKRIPFRSSYNIQLSFDGKTILATYDQWMKSFTTEHHQENDGHTHALSNQQTCFSSDGHKILTVKRDNDGYSLLLLDNTQNNTEKILGTYAFHDRTFLRIAISKMLFDGPKGNIIVIYSRVSDDGSHGMEVLLFDSSLKEIMNLRSSSPRLREAFNRLL